METILFLVQLQVLLAVGAVLGETLV
jgi:hypothetical protein